MVDRTKDPDDKVPDLALRQVFGRQRLPEDLCLLMANCKLLNVESFAMLGDSIAGVKTTLKTIVQDEDKLGRTEAEREISLTSLAAIWKMCSSLQDHFAARRAKMEEDPTKVPEIPGDHHAEFREQFVIKHPDVLLPPHREPHRKFVERIQRDYMVHGAVPFYQVGEMRTRSEQIVQMSGISKTAEDLIKVVNVDQPTQAASETQVIDKLHAFFVALEYLNICEFSTAAGPLRYISEIEEWRHENKGLALLLAVDTLIRKKVYRLNYDQRKQFSTFSAALIEVLTNHKQLWNDARSSAELDKYKQAGQQAPETPVRGTKRSISDEESTTKKPSARAKRNKARRERQKVLLQKAKAGASDRKETSSKTSKDARVPEAEWSKISSFKYSGKRRCPFFNCSLGCRFGDSCRNAHLCVECGRTTLGTGTTEFTASQSLPGTGSTRRLLQSRSARMMQWWIHCWHSCQLRLLRSWCGNLGLKFHVMLTKSLDMAHGFWRSSLALLGWLQQSAPWALHVCHRSTLRCAKKFHLLLMFLIATSGRSSWSWSLVAPSGSFTLALHAIVFQQLAKRMEALLPFVQKSFLKAFQIWTGST